MCLQKIDVERRSKRSDWSAAGAVALGLLDAQVCLGRGLSLGEVRRLRDSVEAALDGGVVTICHGAGSNG